MFAEVYSLAHVQDEHVLFLCVSTLQPFDFEFSFSACYSPVTASWLIRNYNSYSQLRLNSTTVAANGLCLAAGTALCAKVSGSFGKGVGRRVDARCRTPPLTCRRQRTGRAPHKPRLPPHEAGARGRLAACARRRKAACSITSCRAPGPLMQTSRRASVTSKRCGNWAEASRGLACSGMFRCAGSARSGCAISSRALLGCRGSSLQRCAWLSLPSAWCMVRGPVFQLCLGLCQSPCKSLGPGDASLARSLACRAA